MTNSSRMVTKSQIQNASCKIPNEWGRLTLSHNAALILENTSSGPVKRIQPASAFAPKTCFPMVRCKL